MAVGDSVTGINVGIREGPIDGETVGPKNGLVDGSAVGEVGIIVGAFVGYGHVLYSPHKLLPTTFDGVDVVVTPVSMI